MDTINREDDRQQLHSLFIAFELIRNRVILCYYQYVITNNLLVSVKFSVRLSSILLL